MYRSSRKQYITHENENLLKLSSFIILNQLSKYCLLGTVYISVVPKLFSPEGRIQHNKISWARTWRICQNNDVKNEIMQRYTKA